jgi:uncharacterized protein YndB with AHSA1/START domain
MTMNDTAKISETPVVEMSRFLKASALQAFVAWTQAEAVSAWMGPPGVTARVERLEPGVGGRYRFVLAEDDGDHVIGGEYVEWDPPSRLTFTWAWEGGMFAGVETTVELTFAEEGDGTRLTLVHRRLPTDEARKMHTKGWTGCLDCLAAHLSG